MALLKSDPENVPGQARSAVRSTIWVELKYRPFLILLGLGLIVRIFLMVAYRPAVMLWVDSIRFARVNPPQIFADFWMPAGYPILLKILRGIAHQLRFTIAVQHLMGLVVGTLFFLTMRRLRAPRWLAALAAAVPLLSGDHLYLEHTMMADYLLIFLTAAGLSAAVWALSDGILLPLLAVASVLLTLAALVRSVGVILLPILVFCALLVPRDSWRQRFEAASAALLPGAGAFLCYFVSFLLSHGSYLGLSDMRGWNLYSRVAPFADCRQFTPPPGTAVLCEETPPAQRPGPFGYVWDSNSVARRNFTFDAADSQKLGRFAREVILHQPWAYLSAVLTDLARYIDPHISNGRGYSGQPREIVSFGWRDRKVERFVVGWMSKKYRGTKVHLRWPAVLAEYQNLFRLDGLPLAGLIVFTALGMFRSAGSLRVGILLFGLGALGLYVVPVLTVSYDFRYGIPGETFIVVSGLLGALAFVQRKQRRETHACD